MVLNCTNEEIKVTSKCAVSSIVILCGIVIPKSKKYCQVRITGIVKKSVLHYYNSSVIHQSISTYFTLYIRDVKTGFFPKPVIGLQKPVFSR